MLNAFEAALFAKREAERQAKAAAEAEADRKRRQERADEMARIDRELELMADSRQ